MVGKTVRRMMGIVKVRDEHPNVLVKPNVRFFQDLSGRIWHPEEGSFAVHEHQPPVTVDGKIEWFNDREGRQFVEKSSMDFWKGVGVGGVFFAPLTFVAGAVVDRFALDGGSSGEDNQQNVPPVNDGLTGMT